MNFKRFIKILGIVIFILLIIFVLKLQNFKTYNIDIKDKNLNCNIIFKGLEDTRDFVLDDEENYYIAYKNKIQFISKNGKSYDIFKNEDLNITSLEFVNGNLYYVSGSCIYCYNIENKNNKKLIDDLPNFGDYNKTLIKAYKNNLFITIGSCTNSGIVGEDNKWLKKYFYGCDISPKDIVLKGINFGREKTGAFTSYKTKNVKGQIIPGHFPGNGSIIIYNLDKDWSETFAWGIRNIKGLDFNSESKLIASIGGMENRGLRPVIGDMDYIYIIKKNIWYGWPDYSGGDPITSPKFKGKNNRKLSFILENHPTTNPPAPFYQHKSCNSIARVAVDVEGSIGEKDCIYFYDILDNIVYGVNKLGILNKKVEFKNETYIQDMKFYNDKLIVLDNKEGYLFSIQKK